MGYPNDEGLPEHPLWNDGLSACETSIVEVAGSQWLADIRDQKVRSAKRIWGGHGMAWTPTTDSLRHFVITLKEATFECIAEKLAVVKYAHNFDEAFEYVIAELKH